MQIGGRKDEEMSGELGWWCWGERKEEKKMGEMNKKWASVCYWEGEKNQKENGREFC